MALALGLCGYAAQAGGYFAALSRIDVSVLALLIYTYPAMVAAGAVALRRERLDARKLWALALVSGGLVLLMASAVDGRLDPLGTFLGLATAVVYSVYILTSQGIAGRVRPQLLAALVCTGAAFTLTVGAAALGRAAARGADGRRLVLAGVPGGRVDRRRRSACSSPGWHASARRRRRSCRPASR